MVRTLRPTFWCLLLCSIISFERTHAQTSVNSQEQFQRLMPGGLPSTLHYNFDRAYLEANPDSQNCPAASRAFFKLHINKRGEVTKASGHAISFSAMLRGVTLKWAGNLLKQIRFSPLTYGKQLAAVETPVTLVCQYE